MAGAQAGSGIAMEVFVKQHQIAPMAVGLELFEISENWPAAFFIAKKDARHAARQFARDFPQGHHVSGTRRELDLEIRPEIVIEFLQRLDQQVVYREPNGAAPVGVAAEHSGRGFPRLVTHSVFHSVYSERVRTVAMELGQGANSRSEEHTSELQ